MSDLLFLGDEVTAAGYRLGGARVRVCLAREVRAVLEAEEGGASLIVLTAELAAALPPSELARRLRASTPLLVVVGDVRGSCQAPDLATELRASLGVEP